MPTNNAKQQPSQTPVSKFDTPIYVTRPQLPELEEYVKALQSIWQSQHITNGGPILQQFETAAAQYLKVPYASAFVNGHYAIEAAVRALGLSGEVITTAFTFPSTIHALTLNRLQPVFCDIDPTSYNIDHNKIEPLITPKTSAILAVHVFGRPCNLQALQAIADKHQLKLIYDAAHAFGVEVDNHGIGQFGDISIFSLHATKVFHSVEGGLVVYKDEKYRKIFSMLRNFGYDNDSEDTQIVGSNMKMSEFHAAIGLLNLEHVDNWIQKRRDIFSLYSQRLKQIPGLSLTDVADTVRSNYAYCAVKINADITGISRDALNDALHTYNVISRKYFYPLCTELSCYKNEPFYQQTLANAAGVSDNILCLPIHPDMDQTITQRICDIISTIIQ